MGFRALNVARASAEYGPAPNLRFDRVSTDFAVVECKMGREADARHAHLLDPLKLRWTRFSKYCYGLGALAGL